MEESQIELLSKSNNLQELLQILQEFIKNNETVFTFNELNERRVILWTSLFQHVQNKAMEPIHAHCLASLKILSRDKTDIENMVCEKWITTLIDKAGLYNFVSEDDETMINFNMPPNDIAVEAMKCLCNVAFNSEIVRSICASTSIAQGLVSRLRVYKDIPNKYDITLYDMKLMFILTALREDLRLKIREELHGMDYLISCLNDLVTEASESLDDVGAASISCIEDRSSCCLNDNQQAIACEILKTQFNLIMHTHDDNISPENDAMFLKLVLILTTLLNAHCSTTDKLIELHTNIENVLVSTPSVYFPYLTPIMSENEKAQHIYEDRNMDALQSLIQLLQHKLSMTSNTTSQSEKLSSILIVLNKGARSCRAQRKYLRQVVLPPLRDVSRPPEQGNTLRNQLCRLLTTPITSVRDLAAEFLFILCKENVGRMVKYTGFGNAAGHFAQKGLMAGGRGAPYSSSSEDSDTEEYRQARAGIDPVVGCTRPPPSNPFEGMTEEQKEYEAMKLVNLFDKMVTDGVVKPARIGPDGRPHAVEHVLEFREHANDHANDMQH